MKKLFLFALWFGAAAAFSQTERIHSCARSKMSAFNSVQILNQRLASPSALISHEKEYDIKFVHLMLNCERTTKFISGGVRTVATVTAATMDTFACVLHQAHTIDSARINGVLAPVIRKDSVLKINTPATLISGQTVDVTIWYHGTPPVGGSAIGSGFSNGTSGSWGNQVTWSLSEALAGYHWWPCKQILTDKIDSSWVFVTTDSTNKVGSNGILQNVVNIGTKKRYEWKSRTPINYYLISVAIAKYKEYNLYAKPLYLPGDSIWIQNYIYDNAINNIAFAGQKATLNQIVPVLEFECKMYGMYPFKNEKYGHCMAPFGGGMEHQTMTSLGFFDYYVDAHELGHQWWGDNVTCKSWGDIWINEGWASYTEHLVAEHLDPTNFLPNLNAAHNSVMSAPGGHVWITGPDTMDANKVFSSRLSYDKGGSIIRTLQFEINNDSLWFNGLRNFQNTYKNSTASTIDFKNFMQTYTGMNFTQFFNQWYYGEGYPTFNLTWNSGSGIVYLKSSQTTSSATSVPLFITPIEYKLSRTSMPDTTIRVMHLNNVENYTIALLGTVTGATVDPNQWIINKATVAKDVTLGLGENYVTAREISVTPNPGNGVFNLVNLPVDNEGSVEVYDSQGKLVLQIGIIKDAKIDISKNATGVYSVMIKNGKGELMKTVKIVKE